MKKLIRNSEISLGDMVEHINKGFHGKIVEFLHNGEMIIEVKTTNSSWEESVNPYYLVKYLEK